MSEALAWSESLTSNPAAWVRFPEGVSNLISIWGLGMCSLSVFCPVLSLEMDEILC